MEENTILSALKMFWSLMDFGVIGIVLLSGYFAGRYLTSPFISKHISTAWRTLLVSAIFTAIYVLVVKKDGGSFEYTKLFVSYVTATSFYELFIKMLAKYIPSLPNSQTQSQMNKTVFWDIQSLQHSVVSINGVAAPTGMTVLGLPNYNQNFSIGADNTSVNVLMHSGLNSVSLVLSNGQSNYTVNSVICEWNGTRPIRPPR